MNTDLFTPTKSKKDLLLEWILSRSYVRTSEVIRWGAHNYFNRSLRTAQELCKEHSDEIRRLTDSEVDRLFGSKVHEGIWIVEKGGC